MRTTARRAAGTVAVIAVGALLVSGCGSSDDDGAKSDKGQGGGGKPEASASESAQKPDKPSGEASEQAPDDATDDGNSGGSGKSGKLTGIWKAKGKQYVLTFVGDKVTLLRERGRNCTGSLGDAAGQKSLTLKCPDGGDQSRTNGTVGAVESKSIKVTWKGGTTEVYARVSDVPVKLPEEN